MSHPDLHFAAITDALDFAERLLKQGKDDAAEHVIGRALDAFGAELARVDPVAAAMLEADALMEKAAAFRVREAVPVKLDATPEAS